MAPSNVMWSLSRFSTRCAFFGTALTLYALPASANGRYPSANQVLTDPGNARHIVVRTTFGLLQTRDAGATWSWTCEEGFGYAGSSDPALAIVASGHLLVGYARALMVSDDAGCEFGSAFSNVAEEHFVDATLDASTPERALFLSYGIGAEQPIRVFTADEATATLTPGGTIGSDFYPITLEVAPSLPSRIYVTGLQNDFTTALFRSDDAGQTWTSNAIHPDEDSPAYIGAVDPHDPDRLYLRADGVDADVLLVSEDGGRSFTERFSLDGDMLGFALAPDGKRVVIGGPEVGLFIADTDTFAFVATASGMRSLTCLKWTADGLLACADERLDGFTIARSSDEGEHFEPVLHASEIDALSCASSTSVGAVCPRTWPGLASFVGDPSVEPSAPAATAKASGAGCACSLRAPSGDPLLAGVPGMVILFAAIARRRARAILPA